MKKNRDYIIFLEDILDSIEMIEKYIKGYSQKSFSSDEKAKDAVIRRFEIVGEAVKHVPASIKGKHKEVPWNKISGMRNILIHEYFGVNTNRVWKTIKNNLPDLKDKISVILKEARIKSLKVR